MNTIKNGLLDPKIEEEKISVGSLNEPGNSIDDLDDIQVKPSKPPYRPVGQTTELNSIIQTTKKPLTTSKPMADDADQYKVVCYYTNWAWYR